MSHLVQGLQLKSVGVATRPTVHVVAQRCTKRKRTVDTTMIKYINKSTGRGTFTRAPSRRATGKSETLPQSAKSRCRLPTKNHREYLSQAQAFSELNRRLQQVLYLRLEPAELLWQLHTSRRKNIKTASAEPKAGTGGMQSTYLALEGQNCQTLLVMRNFAHVPEEAIRRRKEKSLVRQRLQ